MAVGALEKEAVTEIPSHEEIVARAERVAIALRDNAAEADDLRRVPDDSIRLMKEQGLLRVIQPRRAGGWEMSMRAHLDVIGALAEGCGSAAWVAGVAHAHTVDARPLPGAGASGRLRADPTALVAAVIGPRGRAVRHADGSHTLEGFWPFGSGCHHADWLILGAEVFDEAGEMIEPGDFVVPAGDVEIRDDWYVAGLQGTGSNSLTCKGLNIPGAPLSFAAQADRSRYARPARLRRMALPGRGGARARPVHHREFPRHRPRRPAGIPARRARQGAGLHRICRRGISRHPDQRRRGGDADRLRPFPALPNRRRYRPLCKSRRPHADGNARPDPNGLRPGRTLLHGGGGQAVPYRRRLGPVAQGPDAAGPGATCTPSTCTACWPTTPARNSTAGSCSAWSRTP